MQENINKVITDAAFNELIENADIAFWKVIANHFPQAESGDLSPELTIGMQKAEESAVRQWIKFNVPLPKVTIQQVDVDGVTFIKIDNELYHIGEVVQYQAWPEQCEIGIITEKCIQAIGKSAKWLSAEGFSLNIDFSEMLENNYNPIVGRMNI